LLCLSHPVGGSKARFFRSFGFKPEEWELFAQALKEISRSNDVVESEMTPFGMRFVIDGALSAPNGSKPFIRTVWFIERQRGSSSGYGASFALIERG